MTRRVWALPVVLCTVLVVSGCGGSKQAAKEPTGSKETTQSPGQSPQATQPIEIKIGHVLKTTDGYQVAAEKFKQIVEAKTHGQITVTIIPEGKAGPEKDMMTAVQSGDLDGAIITNGSVTSFAPQWAVLDLPFAFRSYAHGRAVLNGPIGKALSKNLEDAGFTYLSTIAFGFRYVTNSKQDVAKPEDMHGLKLRVLPNSAYQLTMETLTNVKPIVLNWNEVPDALKAGRIDGQENPISLLVSYKMWETQKYATKTGHILAVAPFVFNPTRFQSFTPEQQQIVREAAKAAEDASWQFLDEAEQNGWATLKSNGMKTEENIDRDAFRKLVWDTVLSKIGNQFPAEWPNMILNTQ